MHHYKFFERPVAERLESIKAARGGGSVPPMYMDEIRQAEADGRIQMKRSNVEVLAVHSDSVEVKIDDAVQTFDMIVSACGHKPDCEQLPLIRAVLDSFPAEVRGGFPVLSQDLQWGGLNKLFVIGALASLQVGPDAGNLMGLRRSAQILANTLDLRAWLKEGKTVKENIRGNRYAAFMALDADSEVEEEEEDADNSDTDDEHDVQDASEGSVASSASLQVREDPLCQKQDVLDTPTASTATFEGCADHLCEKRHCDECGGNLFHTLAETDGEDQP